MTNLDQFESVFKAADKPPFRHELVALRSVLIITDMNAAASATYAEQVQAFLKVLGPASEMTWNTVVGDEYAGVAPLLQRVAEHDPDLICVYRNLHAAATEYPHSLGTYVDVLTQATRIPVMLLPHPHLPSARQTTMLNTNSVMAVTDHVAGDHRLVSYAAAICEPGGTLYLTHLEDEATFERYLRTIAKIPSLNTEDARESILEQLLKDARDYIDSCRRVLSEEHVDITIEDIVTVGHHLNEHKRLIQECEVDVVVMNTKDEDQLAIHGLAYPLTIELRDTPLLLL